MAKETSPPVSKPHGAARSCFGLGVSCSRGAATACGVLADGVPRPAQAVRQEGVRAVPALQLRHPGELHVRPAGRVEGEPGPQIAQRRLVCPRVCQLPPSPSTAQRPTLGLLKSSTPPAHTPAVQYHALVLPVPSVCVPVEISTIVGLHTCRLPTQGYGQLDKLAGCGATRRRGASMYPSPCCATRPARLTPTGWSRALTLGRTANRERGRIECSPVPTRRYTLVHRAGLPALHEACRGGFAGTAVRWLEAGRPSHGRRPTPHTHQPHGLLWTVHPARPAI